MKLRISETMDGFFDNYIEMENPGVVDTDRVRELTMAKLGISPAKATRRPARKLGRVLLVAATVVLALTATAVAVYQYGMKDTVIEEMPDYSVPGKTETVMSLNGFADSPEYQAYVEWETWNRGWQQENKNWFKEMGVDDSYYETDVNYVSYYGAHVQEQGDKLTEILNKYGLVAHTDREDFDAEATLCEILGTDDLFDEQYEMRGGYVYEDGAFKAILVPENDPSVWVTVFNAVHGSFTNIGSRMPSEYEEWNYVTADGTEVILTVGDHASIMIASLEGTHVNVHFSKEYTQEELQTLAEGVNFAALNERFAQPVSADMLDVWRESQVGATTTANADDTVETVLSLLGDWWIGDMPDGASLKGMSSAVPDAHNDQYNLTRSYSVNGASVHLSYYELDLADMVGEEARLSLDTYTESDYMIAKDMGHPITECTINGFDAVLTDYGEGTYGLKWLDTEHELLFELHAAWGGMFDEVRYWTEEEVLAMAESVEGTPAAEPLRRSAPTRTEKLSMNIMPLEDVYHVGRDMAEQEVETIVAREKAGELALSEDYERVTDHVWGSAEESWSTGECLYCYGTGDTFRKDGHTFRLGWTLYENENGENASREAFEDERETLMANWGGDIYFEYTVNGYEGYYNNRDHQLTWLDTELGLIIKLYEETVQYEEFGITQSESVYTVEELIELAAQVQPVEWEVPFYEELDDWYSNKGEALSELGAYVVTELPESISKPRVIYGDMYETEPEWYLENEACYMETLSTVYTGGLELYYTRYWSDANKVESINAASFGDMQTYYPLCDADAVTTGLSVNGNPAMLIRYPGSDFWTARTELVWLDTEADMIFALAAYDEYLDEPLSQYDLIAMAESVEKQ